MSQTPALVYAWAAGFVDGEGTIVVSRRRSASRSTSKRSYGVYALEVKAYQKGPFPLRILRRLFGGWLYQYKTQHRTWRDGRVRRRWCWVWCCRADRAERALGLMLPFMAVKRQEAQLGLKFLKYLREQKRKRGNGRYSTAVLQRLERYHLRMKELKQ